MRWRLRESGDAVRARHCDHYASLPPGRPRWSGHERRLNQAELQIDNLRAAFAFSRENGDTGHALLRWHHVCSRRRARGRLQEAGLVRRRPGRPRCNTRGRPWAAGVRALRPGPDSAVAGIADRLGDAQKAGYSARHRGSGLLARALTACGEAAHEKRTDKTRGA